MAQAERLLVGREPAELGIRDVNCFLFGNLVPDVYVGYMVPDPTRKIDYRETHFTEPTHIPEPDYGAFWERYALPSRDASGRVSDVALGTVAHLIADNRYNHRVNEAVREMGLTPGRELRIRKQGDFDLFGRTLDLTLAPKLTGELLAECTAFPQYPVEEPDVRAAVEVARGIVADNREHHIEGTPVYSLLPAELFSNTFAEVDAVVADFLTRYAASIALATS